MIPLTSIERRWTQVALTSIFPSGVAPHVRGADVIDNGAALEDVCRRVPARVALGLRAAVWIFAFGPLLVLHRLRTLAGLDEKARERVVLALLTHRIYVVRQLALLLKAFGALMFVAAAGVREGIVHPESLVRLRSAKPATDAREARDVA